MLLLTDSTAVSQITAGQQNGRSSVVLQYAALEAEGRLLSLKARRRGLHVGRVLFVPLRGRAKRRDKMEERRNKLLPLGF